MIRLNRATEYALMALHHINRKGDGERTSAREVAETYALPFEITAKTLQRLRDLGLIQSAQGARGGYALACRFSDISLAEFIEKLEGPDAVVACELAEKDRFQGTCCEYESRCEVQDMMGDLNARVRGFLTGITLADLLNRRFPQAQAEPGTAPVFRVAPQYAEEP